MHAEVLLAAAGGTLSVAAGWFALRRRRRAVVAARLAGRAQPTRAELAHRLARVAVAGFAGALLGGAPGAVLAGVVVVAWGAVSRSLGRARRLERYDFELVEFLSAFARSLRSGATVHVAVAESAAATGGPVGADLDILLVRLERGSTLSDAFRRWADERPRPSVRSTASALALGHETGGLRAEVVDAVAMSIRQRLHARAEAKGLATQARASATVLAGAPVAFLVFGLVSGSAAGAFLLGSPLGLACLVVGLVLDVAAFAAMLRTVSQVGR